MFEKISGQKFIDYLQATVCNESAASSFGLSSSDALDRQPGAIWHCYHPEHPAKTIPLPLRTAARDGAGVPACTSADYCRILEHYTTLGNQRRPGGTADWNANCAKPAMPGWESQAPPRRSVQPAQLITHRFSLDEIMGAYETFGNAAKERALKVNLTSE